MMKNVNVSYKVNGSYTTKSLAEWFFGASFVSSVTASAKCMNAKSGEIVFRFWQNGTGYLTVVIG